jgi:NAD(P)-dependent dehydrogenase (short-subunit alcohol dehydrogenase family)
MRSGPPRPVCSAGTDAATCSFTRPPRSTGRRCPTWTRAVAGTPPEAFAAVRARQAIGRDLEPGDIAAVVAFLVSDAAGAITGQTLCADGGLILR